MSLDQWILALHVLSAFAYAAGIVLFWVLIVTVRRIDTPEGTIRIAPAAKVGTASVGIGGVGTLLFGLWLAFSVGDYDIWDGWIIAAIVLWAIAGGLGGRTGKEYNAGMEKAQELQAAGQAGPSSELFALNRTQRGLVLHLIVTVVFVLILVDMIWKPGA